MKCLRLVGKRTWTGMSTAQSNWTSARWQKNKSNPSLTSQLDWAWEFLLSCIWEVCQVPLPSALKLKTGDDYVSDNLTQHSLNYFKGSVWEGGGLKLSLVLCSRPDPDQNDNVETEEWDDGHLSPQGIICRRMDCRQPCATEWVATTQV